MYRSVLYIAFFIVFTFFVQQVHAQTYRIKGTVYDSSRIFPMEAVTVLSTSGRGTITNNEGRYEIEVEEKDSIWFSYLNKSTIKYPVLKILNPFEFDISIQVNIPVLKEVKVRPRNYRQDSLQNRIDYAKAFNYQKPKIKATMTGMGVGFDLDEIINMFRFRRNRSMASFKERLMEQERESFVGHRFTKALVRRLTLLDSASLDSFMRIFRPSYLFTKIASDYDFQQYVRESFVRFQRGLPPEPMLKEEEQE